MSQQMQENEFKKELGVRWIKADSGTTYLCPVNALDRLEDRSEDKLKIICVDESSNLHNE